jgi:NADPH-dependent 2,4-dienoyl-CoA reductase/sulfur reductase-like enzyme
MAAAIELDRLGFRTELYEARHELGGGLISSAAPPLKDKIGWYLEHLRHRLSQGCVVAHLGHHADSELLICRRPDIVVLATGGVPIAAEFDGDGDQIISAYDLLMGDVPPLPLADGRIAVYGGGETGCETAELLASRGHDVLLVTRSDRGDLARSAEVMYRKHLLMRLNANPHIEIADHGTILGFREGSILLETRKGERIRHPVAAVVIAQGRLPGSAIADRLKQAGIPTLIIGDASRIGRIGDAVHSAHAAIRTSLDRPADAELHTQ